MKKYLRNSELYKNLKFVMCEEHITTRIDNGRPIRVIDDCRRRNEIMSTIKAMKMFAKNINTPWCSDFYFSECKNCTIYIDGWYDDDTKQPVVTASLAFKRSHTNECFEFIIATLGELDDEEFEPLTNMHYINEGEVLKLSSNFKIKR